MTIRVGDAAVAWARGQVRNPSRNWHNMCQMFVRSCFNVGSRYATAETAYYNTNYRHTSWPPPRGVPVWWTNGRYGHVAISAGNGWCYSTDIKRYGKVDLVQINSITYAWGQRYRGWTEDINEVRIYHAPKIPVVDGSNMAHAMRRQGSPPQGRLLKKAIAQEVGKGRMDMRSNRLGRATRAQYRLVQRKYMRARGQKPTAAAIDGIPGKASLSWLGNRRGFRVIW